MGLQSPEIHAIPSLRHEQHFNQHHHSVRQSSYMSSPSGYPPDTSSRFLSTFGVPESEVESQDSVNEHNMVSEPILPPLDGFPHVDDFDKLVER